MLCTVTIVVESLPVLRLGHRCSNRHVTSLAWEVAVLALSQDLVIEDSALQLCVVENLVHLTSDHGLHLCKHTAQAQEVVADDLGL